LPKYKKYYEAKGEMEKYHDIAKRWKKGYRKRTGSDRYIPREWSPEDDKLILEHKIPDRELSEQIQRSVTAIQVRRCRLKGNKE